jgi:hypothetical protein
MALPETVRVKLSSEAAEAISLSPVVAQEMPLRELVGHLLGVAGKDEARVREILRRGSLVSGASRFRWAGWEADPESLHALLAEFPDSDPSRPFAAANCVLAVLRGARGPIAIEREAGARKGVFQRHSFWEGLMEVISAGPAEYAGYSYRERADLYVRQLDAAEADRIRAAADLAGYSSLRERVRGAAFSSAQVYTVR